MCIVIHNPAGVKPMTRDWFDAEANMYSGACGVMYPEKGKMKVVKVGPNGDLDKVYAAYTAAVATKVPVTLQFRGGSSGGAYNAQPFIRKDALAGWALNGEIDGMYDILDKNPKIKASDARLFGKHFMDYFPVKAFNDKGFLGCLRDMLRDQRMIIQTPKQVIFFEEQDEWTKAKTGHFCSARPQYNAPTPIYNYGYYDRY